MPKVACTNFKCIFRYLDGHSDWTNKNIAHNRKLSGLTYLSTLESGEREKLLNNKDIKKLAVVRNPYSRILSAYKNKLERYKINEEPAYKDEYFYNIFLKIKKTLQSTQPDENIVTFHEFLTWLECSNDTDVNNEHWKSQSKLLYINDVQFDYIGRFEYMKESADYILRELKCDISFHTTEEIKCIPTNASMQIDKYYGDFEKEIVYRLFEDDFINFNYAISVNS